MMRFLVYFRYGMMSHAPHIASHVASEQVAFQRAMDQMVRPLPTPPKPVQ